MLSGIDISHYNGSVDCAKLAAAGVVFAYVKASEGRFTRDPLYAANYAGLKQNRVLRGAYHFFYPHLDAQAQASNFLAVVNHLNAGDLPPALDVEISGEQSPSVIAAAMQQWLDSVQQSLGRPPVIYTSASFWNTALGGTAVFSGYPLWVAEYTGNPVPRIPKGFSDYVFWQYSESGSVRGISGNVDTDWFNGTADDLNRLAGL
jgi:lysozyme